MKTIGLIGGMSWESTQTYYRAINEGVRAQLGGLHSAQIVLVSVDFAPIEVFQADGDWDSAAAILVDAAHSLEASGVDAVMICTNTMHKVADQVGTAISVPLLHIADATGEVLLAQKYSKVALLGTSFTMEQGFYKDRLRDKFGTCVITPGGSSGQVIHRVIYQELCLGVIKQESKQEYLRVIEDLTDQGAQAIILGCTEIGLLIEQADTSTPLIDTTMIHAEAAVSLLLS